MNSHSLVISWSIFGEWLAIYGYSGPYLANVLWNGHIMVDLSSYQLSYQYNGLQYKYLGRECQ